MLRRASIACAALALAGWTAPEPRREPAPLRLDDSPDLPLLAPFRSAAGRPGSHLATWLHGPWGSAAGSVDWRGAPEPQRSNGHTAELLVTRPRIAWLPQLSVQSAFVPPWLQQLDPALASELVAHTGCGVGGACSFAASFPAAAFERVWVTLAPEHRPIPEWQCRVRPVTVHRYGRDREVFERLVRCDGSIGPDALERLSLLARPPEVARPEALPDEPDRSAAPGEWMAGIRVMQPRLLWVLQRIADEHPWRPIYLYSGYRPGAVTGPDEHRSRHAEGSALDLAVDGISNEDLLALCAELPDVGCGYYPNSRFVHIDVRPRGSGSALWIDASAPGERSRYVEAWPGVVERGRVVWQRMRSTP